MPDKIRAATFSLRRRSLSTAKSKLNQPYRGATFSPTQLQALYNPVSIKVQGYLANPLFKVLANSLASLPCSQAIHKLKLLQIQTPTSDKGSSWLTQTARWSLAAANSVFNTSANSSGLTGLET